MRAGRLNHLVIIQQPTEVQDSTGQAVKSWGTYATVWAGVEPLKGREFLETQQINAETTTRIRIRKLAGVTKKMRVSYDSRIYNINAILHIHERQREMHLMCSEGANDG